VRELVESEATCDESVSNGFPLVVIAASAGGIEALLEILPMLPAHFAGCIVVAVHLRPAAVYRSVLVEVLGRSSKLIVKWAQNGESLLPSTVYLAPQDHQTVVSSDRVLHVYRGLRINRFRPAADPLFISAAKSFGSDSIAVVLSGVSRDGAEGAFQLAKAGGKVLVQSFDTSVFADMAAAVMSLVKVDIIASPKTLGLLLAEMADDWSRKKRFSKVIVTTEGRL